MDAKWSMIYRQTQQHGSVAAGMEGAAKRGRVIMNKNSTHRPIHHGPSVHLSRLLLLVLLATTLGITRISAVDPKFDPSTRMRLVLVPADATVGSVIYRLRATDEEFDYPLQFELVDDTPSATVHIETLPCTKYNSVCQANVILTRRLEAGRYYDFQVSVKDTKGGMAQQACSITATNHTTPHDVIFPHKTGIIMIPEDAKRGTELDYVIARKNALSPKPVYLELWGSPLFAIRQKIATPDTTEGTIFLLGPLDFETQSMYHLTVLANDAYAEPGQDTRNIAGLEVVVIVQDVQDVPPIFTAAPPVTRLPAGLLPGDKILQVHAEDGDKGNPREIRYGLVSEGNPFTSFFDINETSGEIFLVRPLDEISAITHIGDPVLLTVIAEEVKVLRDEPPAMATTVQLAFFLPERSNSPPYFENDHYIARIDENAPQGTALVFADPYVPHVYDDDTGKNGVFSLTLIGNNGTFEISPNVAERRASFLVRVRDNQALDFEARRSVQFQILAQELGPATNLSAIVNVTVYIDDVNDNPPKFDEEMYLVELPENMTAGSRVVQVHATDVDTGLGGRVRYSQILGYLNTSLNLDPQTGVVTVTTDKHGFDRELMPEYHLYVEARDEDGKGNAAQVPLIIKLIDVNDNAPVFEKSLYEFILAPNLREFTAPAFIRANDIDAEEPNNIVRYELINGNYENKFVLDKITGQLTLREPLMLRPKPMAQRRRRRRQTPESAADSDVFVLTARAYDLGVPVMFSTTTIRVYPPESKARTVMFIVAGDNPDVRQTEESLSAITGGRVVIHSIRPYTGNEPGATNVGGDSRDKSVVVATVMYDSASFHDISQIQHKISSNATSNEQTVVSTNHNQVGASQRESNAETVYRAENRFLFWLLIALALLIALSILTLLFCCICSWCPLYAGARKRVIRVNSTEDDVHLVHRELGVDKQTKSVQVAEWMGRREAWSAEKSTDSRTKPTHWEFSRRERLRHNQQHAGDDALSEGDDDGDADQQGRGRRHGGHHQRDGKQQRSASDVEKRAVQHRSSNQQTAKETQFHHKSTTNLITDDHDEVSINEETMPGLPEDDEDGEENQHHSNNAAKKKLAKRHVVHQKHQPIDDDSMRRHEIDRGSDIGTAAIQKRPTNEDDDDESPPGERRDQLYIKEGNAEILRLVTRGKNDHDENVYMNVPAHQSAAAPQPHQFIMVDNGGKEILMRRFIEEQANGKHIIREHYQIIPGHAPHHHQPMPNEIHPVHQLHIPPPPPLETYPKSQGSAIYSQVVETTEHQRHHLQVDTHQQQGSNQSLVHMELETSLKQQNALLRQIQLEKEKLEEKYSQHEAVMETQSLPGHSLAIATQTDCEAGTQTDDPYNVRPKPRRARSENGDSMSEQEDYELVRHSPTDCQPGVYWIKKKRRKTRAKGQVSSKPIRRRVVLVDDIKRKIRTPIKEESEEAASPARRKVTETRTSVMRRNRSEAATPSKKSPSKKSSAGLRKEVLLEISDSLDGERSSPEQQRSRSTHSRVVRHIEYYEEDSDDESDNDIVIRRNTYSDSLDDYSGSEELDESHRARGGSRVVHSRQGSLSDVRDPHVVYRKKDDFERRRFEGNTSSAIPRLSRKDTGQSTNERDAAKGRVRRHTAAEHESVPSTKPSVRKGPNSRPKAHSEADILNKVDGDEALASKSVPKYMEWYYSKNQRTEESRPGLDRDRAKAVVTNNKKQVGATEKRIKAKAPRAKSDETKFKPEPLPRNGHQSSNETSRMLREDVQMNKNHAPKIQTDANHPLLQYSEHRFEREYNPAPDLPLAPNQVSHYMYPETPPSARDAKPAKPIRLSVGGAQRPKPSPIHEHRVKDFRVVIPIEAAAASSNPHSKQLNASTLEDDHDSGIAMNSLLHSMARRNPIADKKSVFTIAYDDVKVKKIQSESDSPQS